MGRYAGPSAVSRSSGALSTPGVVYQRFQSALDSDNLRFVWSVALFMTLSIGLSVYNKWVLLHYDYPLLYLSVQFLLLFIVSGLFLMTVLRESLQSSRWWLSHMTLKVYCRRLVPIGVMYGMDIVMTTVAITHGPIAFVEMIKSGAPIMVLLLHLLVFYFPKVLSHASPQPSAANTMSPTTKSIDTAEHSEAATVRRSTQLRAPISKRKMVAISLLSLSEVLIFFTEVDFNWTAFIASICALIASSLKLILIEHLLQSHTRKHSQTQQKRRYKERRPIVIKKSRGKSHMLQSAESQSVEESESAVELGAMVSKKTTDKSHLTAVTTTVMPLMASDLESADGLRQSSTPPKKRTKHRKKGSLEYEMVSISGTDEEEEDGVGDLNKGTGENSTEPVAMDPSQQSEHLRADHRQVRIETFSFENAHVQGEGDDRHKHGAFLKQGLEDGHYFDSARSLPVVGLLNLPADIDFLGRGEPPIADCAIYGESDLEQHFADTGSESPFDSDAKVQGFDDGFDSDSLTYSLGEADSTTLTSTVSSPNTRRIAKQKKKKRHSRHNGIHSILALFYFMPVAFVLTFVGFLCFEMRRFSKEGIVKHGDASHWTTLFALFSASAAMGLCLNWVELLFLQTWSALTLTVMGGVKLLLILLISWAVFEHRVSTMSMAGYLLCTFAVVLYNWTKLKAESDFKCCAFAPRLCVVCSKLRCCAVWGQPLWTRSNSPQSIYDKVWSDFPDPLAMDDFDKDLSVSSTPHL